MRIFLWIASAIPLVVGTVAEASAQVFPILSVIFVVPFPPGGGTDFSAHAVATKPTSM
jgi:tripartite-type tricarboxylate transporter receptor subunit TctC